jgi:hypothetical protein
MAGGTILCADPPKTVAMAHANADIGAVVWPVHAPDSRFHRKLFADNMSTLLT